MFFKKEENNEFARARHLFRATRSHPPSSLSLSDCQVCLGRILFGRTRSVGDVIYIQTHSSLSLSNPIRRNDSILLIRFLLKKNGRSGCLCHFHFSL